MMDNGSWSMTKPTSGHEDAGAGGDPLLEDHRRSVCHLPFSLELSFEIWGWGRKDCAAAWGKANAGVTFRSTPWGIFMMKDDMGWVHWTASKKSAVNGRREDISRIEEAMHGQMRKQRLWRSWTQGISFCWEFPHFWFGAEDLKNYPMQLYATT